MAYWPAVVPRCPLTLLHVYIVRNRTDPDATTPTLRWFMASSCVFVVASDKTGFVFCWLGKTGWLRKSPKSVWSGAGVWSQSGFSGVGPGSEGRLTRCSSMRLACERKMRLKKSSSGTVGPRVGGGGGAHLWSSSREPWENILLTSVITEDLGLCGIDQWQKNIHSPLNSSWISFFFKPVKCLHFNLYEMNKHLSCVCFGLNDRPGTW